MTTQTKTRMIALFFLLAFFAFVATANANIRDDAQALLEQAGLSISHHSATGCLVATPNPDAKSVKIACTGPAYSTHVEKARAVFGSAGYVVEASGLGFTVQGKALVVVK